MRIVLIVFSFLLVLIGFPPAKAQPARDWSTNVVEQPGGGIAVGNPAAKVKLVEWLSYTCSHCADFAKESKVELHAMVRAGSVQVEYRTLPRDGLDLAAGLLVRCGGKARFAGAHDAVFAGQAAMLDKATAFSATPAAAAPMPTLAGRLNQLADVTGLRATIRARGLNDSQTTRCLNDEAAQKRVIAIAEAAQTAGIPGTPAFEIGGRRVDAHSWAELKPQLLAAR